MIPDYEAAARTILRKFGKPGHIKGDEVAQLADMLQNLKAPKPTPSREPTDAEHVALCRTALSALKDAIKGAHRAGLTVRLIIRPPAADTVTAMVGTVSNAEIEAERKL